MARSKKINLFEGFIRVKEPDMKRLAELTMRAKGIGRSLNEFASACGVNASTLSRIVNQKNSGPSADMVIAQIALNADPSSRVTIEKLLDAHGLAPVEGAKSPREVLMEIAQGELTGTPEAKEVPDAKYLHEQAAESQRYRETVQNTLLDLGYRLSLDKDTTAIRGLEFDCHAIFVFDTDALEPEKLNRWAFIRLPALRQQAYPTVQRYFGMMFLYNPVNDGTRVTLITEDSITYFLLRDMFYSAEIPASFSIMLIDASERKILHEFVMRRSGPVEPVRLFDAGERTDWSEVFGQTENEKQHKENAESKEGSEAI